MLKMKLRKGAAVPPVRRLPVSTSTIDELALGEATAAGEAGVVIGSGTCMDVEARDGLVAEEGLSGPGAAGALRAMPRRQPVLPIGWSRDAGDCTAGSRNY